MNSGGDTSGSDPQTASRENIFTPIQNAVLEHLINVKAMTGGGCSIQDISDIFTINEIQ